jgi:hypothetical protein
MDGHTNSVSDASVELAAGRITDVQSQVRDDAEITHVKMFIMVKQS